MKGRNLSCGGPSDDAGDPIADALRQVRSQAPLRQRLKQRGETIARAQEQMEAALAQSDGLQIGAALAATDPAGAGRSGLDWRTHAETLTLWVGRLWEADDGYPLLAWFWEADPLPGAGLWLPAAVLHLRDPQTFTPWNDAVRQGYAALDDALDGAGSTAERYRLFNEGAAWLRGRYAIHPLEIADILAALAPETIRRDDRAPAFGGFCPDTFRFITELAADNRRQWMEAQRDRYRFAVREPLTELCQTLAAQYVRPVLHGVHGWDLEAEARSGRALTSICKNDYGRSRPYNTALWIAFCRPHPALPQRRGRVGRGNRRGAQLFVRLDAAGLRYGLRISRKAKEASADSATMSASTAICFIGRCATGARWPPAASAGRRPGRRRTPSLDPTICGRGPRGDRSRSPSSCRPTPLSSAATSWPARSC